MTVEITGFNWVPDFARGYVRDLRPRWACEEIGLPYAMRLISPVPPKPASYFGEQPWGQVPVLHDGDIRLFESGAILLHLAEKDTRLLSRDPQQRATSIAWLFAALNSVEPGLFELGNVTLFSKDAEWAKLRLPSLMEDMGKRLDRLADALGEREWLGEGFSVADIAMVTVLRNADGSTLITSRPALAAYVERGMARPAFRRAMAAQLADFQPAPVAA
ncbi:MULTISPECIES: glutathione S-transferase family protein [unclassified Sphingomonas]|uniref:glutathione S-transferase family protein n=1 Tax=Sphingomonas TaxID=13687 RepID=UPI0009639547|nr:MULTISPECIES: glutathione S-transferase family protein [unclassified Sphingomonas]MBN8812178.1 glutathione S-transferase family protein [Sphingomonas sp.]OJY47895.1 MAG: glutathione S-transferase [Sphingomonas sp. 67-41]